MTINYAALQNEILSDPIGYGYAPHVASGSDDAIAGMLNTVRNGSDGFPAIVVRRKNIQTSDVLETIDNRDFIASPDPLSVAMFESITQQRSLTLIDEAGNNTRILGNIMRLLQNPSPNGSRGRLNTLASKNGSRAEQLFGTDTVITHTDVAIALRG